MKLFICILMAFAASGFIQAQHWKKILDLPLPKRRKYLQPPHYILSAVFVFFSSILGIVATEINNDMWAYGFAALIGFSPWATIKALTKGAALGPENEEEKKPATLREFIQL